MAFSYAVARLSDGSDVEFSKDSTIAVWDAIPDGAIMRIDVDPPNPGARGDFEVVISGCIEYWAYKPDGNTTVFGCHGATDGVDYFYEHVVDRRPGRDRVDRDVAEVPAAAAGHVKRGYGY